MMNSLIGNGGGGGGVRGGVSKAARLRSAEQRSNARTRQAGGAPRPSGRRGVAPGGRAGFVLGGR